MGWWYKRKVFVNTTGKIARSEAYLGYVITALAKSVDRKGEIIDSESRLTESLIDKLNNNLNFFFDKGDGLSLCINRCIRPLLDYYLFTSLTNHGSQRVDTCISHLKIQLFISNWQIEQQLNLAYDYTSIKRRRSRNCGVYIFIGQSDGTGAQVSVEMIQTWEQEEVPCSYLSGELVRWLPSPLPSQRRSVSYQLLTTLSIYNQPAPHPASS
jgi:hypothetical protein